MAHRDRAISLYFTYEPVTKKTDDYLRLTFSLDSIVFWISSKCGVSF